MSAAFEISYSKNSTFSELLERSIRHTVGARESENGEIFIEIVNLLAEFLRRIFPIDHHTGKTGIVFDDANKVRLIGGKHDFEPAFFKHSFRL